MIADGPEVMVGGLGDRWNGDVAGGRMAGGRIAGGLQQLRHEAVGLLGDAVVAAAPATSTGSPATACRDSGDRPAVV